MKKLKVRKSYEQAGFSLVEMLVVLGIMGVLLTLGSLNWNKIMTKYNEETDAKTIRTTLIYQQIQASNTGCARFVTIQPKFLQPIEDTNNNGVIDPTPTDTYESPVKLRTEVASTLTTFLIQKSGVISDVTSSVWTAPTLIKLSPADVGAEYDCIEVYPTLVRVAKQNGGGGCDPK